MVSLVIQITSIPLHEYNCKHQTFFSLWSTVTRCHEGTTSNKSSGTSVSSKKRKKKKREGPSQRVPADNVSSSQLPAGVRVPRS